MLLSTPTNTFTKKHKHTHIAPVVDLNSHHNSFFLFYYVWRKKFKNNLYQLKNHRNNLKMRSTVLFSIAVTVDTSDQETVRLSETVVTCLME